MQCGLCSERGLSRDICYECEGVIFQTREILKSYSTGNASTEIRSFMPETSFTFERDYRRARRYFKVAQELIVKSIFEYPNAPIPRNELEELTNRDESEVQTIMELLGRARIARAQGNLIYLEEMSQRIAQIIPAGSDLSSKEYQDTVEEMKGILCIVLAQSLIDIWLEGEKQYGRPRKYLLYMKGLSRQLLDQTVHISRSVDFEDFFPRGRQLDMSEEQRKRIFGEDVLALSGGRSKIFEHIFAEPGSRFSLAFKESVIIANDRNKFLSPLTPVSSTGQALPLSHGGEREL